MQDTKRVMADVRTEIRSQGISESQAARKIGVTTGTLNRHLAGAYVRTDSLAKYRRWLTSDAEHSKPAPEPKKPAGAALADPKPSLPLTVPRKKPPEPHRVVDLFSGCGGLSLGFELAAGGGFYRTVLAIDIEEAMVRVFNANHPQQLDAGPIGRQADLSEFLNEAEVLAYYLDHVASSQLDSDLTRKLERIRPIGLPTFLRQIQSIDEIFLDTLTAIRQSNSFLDAYTAIDKTSLSQTSVIGFHNALKLPQPGTGRPTHAGPLWGVDRRLSISPARDGVSISPKLERECAAAAGDLWNVELSKLRARATGAGDGQLASAARKIQRSLQLIDSDSYRPIKDCWVRWRAARDSCRRALFENESVLKQLRGIYRSGPQVHVLLGGPPCQGFSRIGRGKIRSLREQSVHVHSDGKAGDKRNELMLQYVLFVAALAPTAFLFENVRHFQAEVKTPDGAFNATDVLAGAISDISRDGLEYEVASRILVASDHLVPQARERFFMLGIRRESPSTDKGRSSAESCLSLPVRDPVPLKTAISGLPAPLYSSSAERAEGTESELAVDDCLVGGTGAGSEYLQWVRQPAPIDRPNHDHSVVDAHCTRDSRADDRAFFEMLGPGKRWMDYRCDGNPLIDDLATLVQWLLDNHSGREVGGIGRDRIEHLLKALDGSLSLRLLLDRIPLRAGEPEHHLCAPNYLKKREGSHGDWLARLDAETPSKTMVSHMGKDTYAYIHPSSPRTISVREAARVQTFPDWFRFGTVGLVDGYRIIGNAVPPLLSAQLALRLAVALGELSQAPASRRDRSPQRQSRSPGSDKMRLALG
jgi:site-specific DNA-cytosine methylase